MFHLVLSASRNFNLSLIRPLICICNDQYAPALRELKKVRRKEILTNSNSDSIRNSNSYFYSGSDFYTYFFIFLIFKFLIPLYHSHFYSVLLLVVCSNICISTSQRVEISPKTESNFNNGGTVRYKYVRFCEK